LYPRFGNEDALICPKCNSELTYDKSYSSFVCTNSMCKINYRIMDIRKNMKTTYEEEERRMIFERFGLNLPNFNKLVDELYK